ncbi:MAG: 23S rRNA pseudouridine(1911/1915/1917) synthase RluD [Candidatus Thiodiazotropha sp. (ex Troendleina suluensis)]|nr:23S rRNA pseudouridine(1911/1915/1917) synthase RluD [Candidatus Thiodiazotropha sp. (ex Troendleina suluensis)]
MSDGELIDKVPHRVTVIPEERAGSRLDQVLAEQFPEFSRNRLQHWIKQGLVELDGRPCKAKEKVRGGEAVSLRPLLQEEVDDLAQEMVLDLIYEDDALLVVNKPAGLVMHPAAGNPDGTLLNGLLSHHPPLKQVPRAGIVHRLDKETSGLLVVAKTLQSQHRLVQQLQARSVKREYLAIVQGQMIAGGTVDEPVGRHPVNRLRMAVIDTGKRAITHYRVVQRFRAHTLLRVNLETGRTHQIRVHMSHIRHPLLGDPLYGGRLKLPSGANEELQQALKVFRRQALHATRLELKHPETGETMAWEAQMPSDMQQLLERLEKDAEQ